LGLRVIIQRDGTLEVSGTFGLREMRRGGEPESVWKSVTGEDADEALPPHDPTWQQGDRCRDRRSSRPTPITTTALPFTVSLDADDGMEMSLRA
jgi:hypothetical protein